MAKLKQALQLKHQANLSEDVEDVALGAGESVTVLKEWQNHYLVKNGEGKLFNVPKSAVEK
jgi:hypothetical protein